MARINWVRMLGGGLIAAIIAFLTDGSLHERLLSATSVLRSAPEA